MKIPKRILVTGNQAAAHIAYRVNDVCMLYPITPSSEMSELVEAWSANQQRNIFGSVPTTFQMQSEAGVAGAMHGALKTGSLATTFTASQGLLLMQPNMYKIAGALTPNVIHVATRSIATHALSIFGDHSDIMAVRNTGYAFLGGNSVQEAHDLALIAQAATLKSRIPFVHFFDGFRTSHEKTCIDPISDQIMDTMLCKEAIQEHRSNALNSNAPKLSGTAQGPDVFFQSREAINTFYEVCPDIVQTEMDALGKLTGRSYKIMEYVGSPNAKHVIIAMGSATTTIAETILALNKKGENAGAIIVRLFRPFSTTHLHNALPKTCESIAVLDRTKEPGASGEPLYLDVVQAITQMESLFLKKPKVIGGRYGLSSKEFTPTMVHAILENMKRKHPKNSFTVGINDDVTGLSLESSSIVQLSNNSYEALFYETKSPEITKSLQHLLKTIPTRFVQEYTEIDYRKRDARNVTNLRFASRAIKAPYLITEADFIACDSLEFVTKDNVLNRLKTNGILVVNTSKNSKAFWDMLPFEVQEKIHSKNIALYIVNCHAYDEAESSYENNISKLHQSLLTQASLWKTKALALSFDDNLCPVDTSVCKKLEATSTQADSDFAHTILGKLLSAKGDELSVSNLPASGTFPTNTSKWNLPNTGETYPSWDVNACTQCGACSMACPQAAIRIKVYNDSYKEKAPTSLKIAKTIVEDGEVNLLNYTLQVNTDQCTSCEQCIDSCSAKALTMVSKAPLEKQERRNWDYFTGIPEYDRLQLNPFKVNQQQLQEPLFKYSQGVMGCGEAPYLKLMSQLFGDRMLVANATGASSIFGGALPTTPWSTNHMGRGPAWSNSLFEDNAEFGLGYRLSLDQQEEKARVLLKKLTRVLDFKLVQEILTAKQESEAEIAAQRLRIEALNAALVQINSLGAAQLLKISDCLIKQSVWIVGGDGWAYDIGYGGLDHVIASGENVNILVLDNEVYSNTGGQMSKATPLGAKAKFATNGKQKQKKDLGRLAMCYDNVYVASVAIGADQEQTLKAFHEAESYNGPSIIMAYCHSQSHGIDMKRPSQYQKAAVASGQWLLYRNDPRRTNKGLSPMQLDSEKPSMGIAAYLAMEARFDCLKKKDSTSYDMQLKASQHYIDQRYQHYFHMMHEHVNTELLH